MRSALGGTESSYRRDSRAELDRFGNYWGNGAKRNLDYNFIGSSTKYSKSPFNVFDGCLETDYKQKDLNQKEFHPRLIDINKS